MINTGLVRSEGRPSASPDFCRQIEDLFVCGRHAIPISGYEIEIVQMEVGCFGLILNERCGTPRIAVAVADSVDTARTVWSQMLGLYEIIAEWPGVHGLSAEGKTMPESVPWYATAAIFADQEELLFLTDFCRHFAWGWLDHRRRQVLWGTAAIDIGFPSRPHPLGRRRIAAGDGVRSYFIDGAHGGFRNHRFRR